MKQIVIFSIFAVLNVIGNPTELSDENGCLLQLHQQMGNMLNATASGIVGVSWDDLTNKMTLPIFATTFTKCKTTPDGHFLIPDNVLAVPVQEVFIDRTAKSYKSYNDIEKDNIRAERHEYDTHMGRSRLSGTFSKSNEEIKKIFSKGNMMMFEAQIGYKAFTFIAEEAELNSAFRGKIDEIIESLDLSHPILAKYQAECIIRDYGTHVVNKVLTGASMKYKAFMKTSQVDKYTHESGGGRIPETEASETFLRLVELGMDRISSSSWSASNNKTRNSFEDNVQYSTIETKGGSDVRKILKAKEGEGAVSHMDNIVGLEHEGIPIYTLINKNYFRAKQYDTYTLLRVQNLIFNATKEYYEVNTVFGCTDPTAENFDYQANYDEGESCKATKLEFLFDGIFQRVGDTRIVYSRPIPFDIFMLYKTKLILAYQKDMIPKFTVNHPLTNHTSCPEGYEEIMLTTANLNSSVTWNKVDYGVRAITEYKTYWCRRVRVNGTDTSHKSALFGGFIIDGENVITRSKGCPTDYDEVLMFEDTKLCLSYKYDIGKVNSISFGGFYSCETREKDCPKGYSAHLLKIHYGCAVYYCVLPYVHNYVEPTLVRPPFIKYSDAMVADIPNEIDFEFKNETMTTTIPDLHSGTDNSTNSSNLNQKPQSLF
uniref:Macrophage-expressed gene 1 protein n=1 Tax=Panagrolaimus davidi TaxID=227884 RepID=A0A914PIW4_9BILA